MTPVRFDRDAACAYIDIERLGSDDGKNEKKSDLFVDCLNIWSVSFMDYILGYYGKENNTFNPGPNPFLSIIKQEV